MENLKKSTLNRIIVMMCIAMGAFQLYTAFFGVLTVMWQRSIHLGFALAICALLVIEQERKLWKKGIAAICGIVGVSFATYMIVDFNGIILRYGRPNTIDLVAGGALIVVVLWFAAIKTGKILPGIAIAFLLYALCGENLPGLLSHRGYTLSRVITQTSLGTEGIFGVSLGVSATYVYLFILFGSLLTSTSIGQFYIDFAIKALGKSPGGPAKAAVASSCLFGSVSGSAVANVAGTGVITIKLMKETGYPPAFAGAVEAVASTGGQIMPPMMGAAAFIMSEMVGIPYYQIALGALVPALIYYGSVFSMVHFQARATGLDGIDTSHMPSLKKMLKEKGVLVLPLLALLFFLMGLQMTAMRSAVFSIIITVLVGIFFCKTTPAQFLGALIDAGKSCLVVVASTGCAGIIVSIVNLTGLGLKFSNMMVDVAGSSMFLVLVMLMIASLILGMGLPTTPAYLILAALGAPTLIRLGADEMASHLFVLYFGAISMITPPVAMAVYTAASIAKANFWKTAGYAMTLAIPAFIVPYLFVMEPAMLFRGDMLTGLIATATGIIGSIYLSAGISGWFICRTNIWKRLLLICGGLMLIVPFMAASAAGAIIVAIVSIIQWMSLKDSVKLQGVS